MAIFFIYEIMYANSFQPNAVIILFSKILNSLKMEKSRPIHVPLNKQHPRSSYSMCITVYMQLQLIVCVLTNAW